MENKILNEIREKYNNKLQVLKKYEILAKRIKELEENETVKEYLELIKLLEEHEGKRFSGYTEEKLMEFTFNSMLSQIKETNNIYVCMGTYMLSNEHDIEHGPRDIRLNRDDEKAQYRIYKNIETYDSESISIKKCDEFERTHKIIYPRTALTDEFFYAIQHDFFIISIKESQEAACNKILSEEYLSLTGGKINGYICKF